MSDTRRSLSALQALLADNSSGDISAQHMRDVLVSVDGENSVQSGAYSSLPGSGQKIGDIYICTDSIYWFRWDGSAWKPFVGMTPVKLPPTTGWTWVNQSTATVSTTGGMVTISDAGHLALDSVRVAMDAFGRGDMGGITVQSMITGNDRDFGPNDEDLDPPHGDDVAQPCVSFDVTIWFEEG
jgi:hypothetical protein